MKKGKRKRLCREFPGGPVVGTPHFHAEGPPSISAGWGTSIPQAEQQSQKKKKKKLLEENIFATLEYTKILLTGQKKALTIGKNG